MRSLVILLLLGRVASAHQTSVKYVNVTIDEREGDGRGEGRAGRCHRAARAGRGLEAGRERCRALAGGRAVRRTVDRDHELRRGRAAPCAARRRPTRRQVGRRDVGGRVPGLADRPRLHAILRPRHAPRRDRACRARRHDSIVRADSPRLVLRAKPSLLAWVREGMNHIYTGPRSHQLRARAAARRHARPEKPDWQLRAPVATLRATATVITAFTIAHCVSLISASLGWVHLPSRFVESMIAAVDRVHRVREHPQARRAVAVLADVRLRSDPRPRVREHALRAAAASRCDRAAALLQRRRRVRPAHDRRRRATGRSMWLPELLGAACTVAPSCP